MVRITNGGTRIYAIGELFEHDGRLAQYRGNWREYDAATDRAYVAHRIAVAEGDASDYPYLMRRVPDGHDWSGYVYPPTSPSGVFVDTSRWQIIESRSEIRRPPDTRRLTSEWSEFSKDWQRIGWPLRCVCGEYHDPKLMPCDTCGECHKPNGKHRGGIS